MRCIDCLFYYTKENDLFPYCQFVPHCAGDLPPCEEDEEIEDDDW